MRISSLVWKISFVTKPKPKKKAHTGAIRCGLILCKFDEKILAMILYMYNHTEIEYGEVEFLWVEYLNTGKLDFATAICHARERIADEEDIRETEMELLYWLHSGI